MNALIHYFGVANFISANKAGEIASAFAEKIVLNNGTLLTAGHFSDEYFFLEQGFMRAYTLDTDGNDVTTSFFSKIESSLK